MEYIQLNTQFIHIVKCFYKGRKFKLFRKENLPAIIALFFVQGPHFMQEIQIFSMNVIITLKIFMQENQRSAYCILDIFIEVKD